MNKAYFKKNVSFKLLMVLMWVLILIVILSTSSNNVSAVSKNLSVKIYTPLDFTSIWLGISTGGYDVMTERGTTYTYRVFIKNGMNNNSLQNIYIIPNNLPFKVNSITPKSFEQLKPMEIKIYLVNITIPKNATIGKYTMNFDVASDEFPPGIFRLQHELKVVDKINIGLYVAFVLITVIILVWFFIRKTKIWKEDKGKKEQSE